MIKVSTQIPRGAVLPLVGFLTALVCSFPVEAGKDHFIQDSMLTPGLTRDLTVDEICNTKWGKDRRHVTKKMVVQVLKNYHTTRNDDSWCHKDSHGRRYEIDHLISRELGGADDVANLWPQCYSGKWNAIMKDRYENLLHKLVCAYKIDLSEAQTEISKDWRKGYIKYFGEPK